MEDFNQYLSDEAGEAERATAEGVRQGLAGLRLENKVAAVAAERKAWLRRRFRARVTAAAAVLLVLAAALFLFFREKHQPVLVPPANPSEQPQLPGNQVQPPTESTPEKHKIEPIAANRPEEGPTSPYPAPNIRGENSENKAWQALLDRLWYTDYPAAGLVLADTFHQADQLLKARDFTGAYVRLQRLERNIPANDTLRFLKGYCLLELGEGSEALTYFNGLEMRQPSWAMRLDWYRGLSLLMSGDKSKALTVFRKISAHPRHSYRKQSERAIRALQ